MTTALAWLNDLAQWIGRFFPRLTLVHPTHKGVRFGPRGVTTAVGPGLVIYWPLIHELLQVPITTISFQTSTQILDLTDATPPMILPQIAAVGVAVQFRVVDPIKAAVKALNFHAIVDNRVQAAISRHWQRSLVNRTWCEHAKMDAAEALLEYGIDLEHLDITHLGRGCALKNLSDWSYSDHVDGRRPS